MTKFVVLPFSVYILLFAQTINLTMAVLSVTVGAVVGLRLAPHAGLATIPYGLQFLGVMLFTYIASYLMRRRGRAFVFYLASMFLFVSGVLGYWALDKSVFIGLCLSHFFLGLYIACANFYRFAATDGLDVKLKPKAISLVVFGGVLASFIGPFLATTLKLPQGAQVEFAFCYLAMSGFALLNTMLVWLWGRASLLFAGRTMTEPTQTPSYDQGVIWSAIGTSAVGYLVMNLLMILASLLMQGLCSFSASSQAIQWHVLSMFLPSFFTGVLIQRFGHSFVVQTGFVLLSVSALMGAMVVSTYATVVIELVILGLGWNFSYVGGSALLASKVPTILQHKLQGLNDTVVALCATTGAFLPSIAFSYLGWSATHWGAFVLCVLMLVINRSISNRSA